MVEVKKNFTLGTLFGETFNLYFQNFLHLIIPAVIFFGASAVLVYLTYLQMFSSFNSSTYFGPANISLMISYFVVAIFFLPFYYYQIQVASNCYLNKNESPSKLIQLGLKRFFPLLGMTFLYILGLLLGSLALIIPAYIIMIGWSLNSVVFVLEKKGASASLKRSWALTKGYKGKLFLIFIILFLIMYAVMIIAMILGRESLLGLVSGFMENSGESFIPIVSLGFSALYAIGYILLFPLYTVFLIVVYYNILKDKEGFATEQLAEEFMSQEQPGAQY